MNNFNVHLFLKLLLEIGDALQNSGAEIYRAEDTLCRIGYAYGAEEIHVFIITSCIEITLQMKDQPPVTQMKRIQKFGGNHFQKLEQLNALSRSICQCPIPLPELENQLHAILHQPVRIPMWIGGNILAASSFTLFFGGSLPDAVIAGGMGILIWIFQFFLAPICMNTFSFQFFASFISGFFISALSEMFPGLHANQIMIGDIMLLIPGIMYTNAISDLLLGDTLSGILRLINALLLAAVLALGFLASLWLTRRIF